MKGQESLKTSTSLPAEGMQTLLCQEDDQRLIVHLLYVSPVHRGDLIPASGNRTIEIIEDIIPLYDISVTVRTDRNVLRVMLVPEESILTFQKKPGEISFTVPKLWCHQMVAIEYE